MRGMVTAKLLAVAALTLVTVGTSFAQRGGGFGMRGGANLLPRLLARGACGRSRLAAG